MRCLIVVALLTTRAVGRRNHSIVPAWRNATWTPRCRCNVTTTPKKKPQSLWSRVFGGRKKAAPPRKPKYALELSGGLRTFLVTWPALSCALVERNGGRGNWWLGLEAPYDAAKQADVAAAARSVVRDWDHVNVYAESANATCAFYGAETCGSDQYRLKLHFAYQWEAVARCHAALERSPLFKSIELVVRARPDVVLLRDLALDAAAATMARARAPALVPCVVGQKMYIDDFVVATKRAMAEYVKAEGAFDLVPGCCEKLVWFRLSPLGPVIQRVGNALCGNQNFTACSRHRREFPNTGHAIVDIPMIEKYVRDGRFVFKRHHGRCATATEMEWPRDVCPAMLLPRYSEENYRILERYMRAHAYTAAKSAHVVRRR